MAAQYIAAIRGKGDYLELSGFFSVPGKQKAETFLVD